MRQDEYDTYRKALHEEADRIQTAKRPGYVLGNTDVLHNFKSVAERAGVTPEQTWSVYFLKHIDAIISIMCHPHLPAAEEAVGRFSDAHNYLDLGWALLAERQMVQLPAIIEYRQCSGQPPPSVVSCALGALHVSDTPHTPAEPAPPTTAE